MKIALLQLNPTVGDIAGNAGRLIEYVKKAKSMGAGLCVAPELYLPGYPPKDLLLNKTFIERGLAVADRLAEDLADCPPVLFGMAVPNKSGVGKPLYNAAVLARGGKITASFYKCLLPTYDVFDEDRYFEPARGASSFSLDGLRLGVTICEDIWNGTDESHRLYKRDPLRIFAEEKTDCILNLSGSPFTIGKQAVREALIRGVARRFHAPVLYVNQVGGNDDLVFDGRSIVCSGPGEIVARGRAFSEDIILVDPENLPAPLPEYETEPEEEAFGALVMGTRDYIRKCGFSRGAILGLSGGIDSALTAVVAAEAVGPGNVLGVLMPSPYSSAGSVDDSLQLARNIGIGTITVPISGLMDAFNAALKAPFADAPRDITEENIQSRIRGNLLMALSNKRGALLLTTGNKSELAVGYCTIYGDMSGGLAVISDLPKTMVYRISRWLNANRGGIIPQAVIDKAPSAELRPDQTDQDSLPPYDILDQVLHLHIERHLSAPEIMAAGFDKKTVGRVLDLVRKSEFKRKQAAPGIKITDRAFGTGWRMPIACDLSVLKMTNNGKFRYGG